MALLVFGSLGEVRSQGLKLKGIYGMTPGVESVAHFNPTWEKLSAFSSIP